MKKVFLSLISLLMTAVMLLSSCGTGGASGDGTTTLATGPKLQIAGVDISEFRIVYESFNVCGEKAAAEKLAAFIRDTYKVELEVVSEEESAATAHEILIGQTADRLSSFLDTVKGFANYRVDYMNGMLVTQGGHLWVATASAYATEDTVKALIERMTPSADGATVNLDLSTAETSLNVPVTAMGAPLKVLSYNVYTGELNGQSYKDRAPGVYGAIRDYDPDIIGLQELHTNWRNALKELGLLNDYTFLGRPRNGEGDVSDGNQYSPILYRTSMFTEIESGTYWLSDTPNVPSKTATASGKAQYNRVVTYAVLERKADGVRFLYTNTHFEHTGTKSETLAKEIKIKQANIFIELIDKIIQKHGDMPVISTGDFNMESDHAGYSVILSGDFANAREGAKISNGSMNKIIDYCFVSKGDFWVYRSDFGTKYSCSDHKPLCTEVYFTSNTSAE